MRLNAVVFSFLFLLVGLIGYQTINSDVSGEYRGYTVLSWADVARCGSELPEGFLFDAAQTTTYKARQKRGRRILCKSHWLELKGNTIELDIAGSGKDRVRHPVRIEVQLEDPKESVSFTAPNDDDLPQNTWRVRRHTFQDAKEGTRFRIVLADAMGSSWMGLRNRVNFYQSGSVSFKFWNYLNSNVPRILIALVAGLGILVYWNALNGRNPASSGSRFLALLFIAIGVHFRKDAYFMLDDWILIHNLSENLASTWGTFNAHFIPVFVAFFRLENYIFGANYEFYQLTSIVLLSLNGLLLAKIVLQIYPPSSAAEKGAAAASLLYVVSAFHADSSQWAICQTIVLSVFAVLLSVYCGLKYLRGGRSLYLYLALVAVFFAPLAFGQGLVAMPYLIGFVFLASRVPSFSSVSFRYYLLCGGALVACAFSLVMYVIFQGGEGDQVGTSAFQGSFDQYLRFVRTSVLYTGVSGAMGFISFRNPGLYYPHFMDWINDYLSVETGTYYWVPGVLILVIVAILNFRTAASRINALVGVTVALAFLVAPLALVAIGRAHYPFYQTLAFRYQALSLIGLILLFLPLLVRLFERSEQSKTWASLALALGGTLYLGSQLNVNADYLGYWRNGAEFKRYIPQLVEWTQFLETSGSTSYAADGTQSAGAYPISHGNSIHYHSALPPVLNPLTHVEVLHYLQQNVYKSVKLPPTVAESVPNAVLHAVLSP